MADLHSPDTTNPTFLEPVNPAIETYMRGLYEPGNHTLLIDMEQMAKVNKFPIVERLVGMFLETMTKTINAKRIFEFGSGFGYSAYFFATATGFDGRVMCSDGDPANKTKAQVYLTKAGLWDRIDFQTGMAQTIFKNSTGDFDICYNDADKGDYPEIWLMAKERIRPGGLYIADNVLWHGRVALTEYTDIVPGWTEAIKRHNELIFNDAEFDAFINPIRDGVLVARRKT